MEMIVERLDKDKIFRVNLEKTLTQTLDTFRTYLYKTEEEINEDAINVKDKLSLITPGMEKRDIEALRINLTGWNKEDLLDVLYELEYLRFMDIKLDTEGVFEKYIAEHFRTATDSEGYRRTIYFGLVGTVIDVITISKLDILLSKITNLQIEGTDILYYNSDKRLETVGINEDGTPKVRALSKSIILREPVEVEKGWLDKTLANLIGDGTPLARERKRNLKYHRTKLVIQGFTFGGKRFRATEGHSRAPITLIAAEIYRNRMSKGSDRYFIELKVDEELGVTLNMAMYEIFYRYICQTKSLIDTRIMEEYPVGSMVLYTFSEMLNSVVTVRDTGHLTSSNKDNVVRKGMNCHSFGKAIVTENNPTERCIKMMLTTLSGTTWVIKENIKVTYDELFRRESLEAKTLTSNLFIPDVAHNNQKGLVPAAHAWDFIHPTYMESLLIPEKMYEVATPLHWRD